MQQKLLYMLLIASRKLRHYFQGHHITVVTSYPLEQVLRNPNVTGHGAEWAVELQPFELTFETTKVIKSKALAEFTAEWTDPYAGEAREEESTLPGVIALGHWTMHFDGTFNTPAEYEGLLAGLRAAGALGIKCLIVKGDSQLVVNFSNKSYTPKDEHMAAYLEEHREMEKRFLGMELKHVPRGENQEDDDIARRASHRLPQRLGTFVERLLKPSATPPVESNELLAEELPPPPTTGAPDCGPPSGNRTVLTLTRQDEVDWITELKSYLMDGKLPEGNEEAERVARQASGYCIKDGDLYRRCANGIALKCVSIEEGRRLLSDIHAGECGHHSSVSTLTGKVYRSGLYWPTTLTNGIELVRACEACQFHAKQIHQPAQEMQTIPLTWPFAVWGLDILGPFPWAKGGCRYLYVAIDKFTKWAEVEPARTIPARSTVNFIKGLVCRFGVPSHIITDNGSQFTSGLFRAYCASIGTKICYVLWLTREATARPSTPMPRCSRASRRKALTPSSKLAEKNGSRASSPCCGQYAQLRPSLPAKHLSSSSTGLKRSSPLSSSMGHHESSPSTNLARRNSSRIACSFSRRLGAEPPSARLGTRKGCTATTATTSVPGRSRLVTSS
ncbi:hypothetical protein ACQ4PT_009539 [Festuca glaucescens]